MSLPVNQVLTGNCIEIMKSFPAESIDVADFSPPYYGQRDYQVQGQIGLEPTWQEYTMHMIEVCQEVKRILKKTGSMYIVIGDTYAGSHCGKGDKTLFQNYRRIKVAGNLYGKASPQAKATDYKPKCLMGIPWRLAFALIDDGWILRNDCIWHKPNAMPSSVKDRLTQTYEHIFFFVKSRKYYYDLNTIRESHQSFGDKARHGFGRKSHGGMKQNIIEPSKGPEIHAFHVHGKNPGDVVLTKHDIAVRRFPTVNRRGGIGYTDPLHVKPRHPKGKNPGDIFQTQKEPYIGNNPHRMRLEKDKHIALVASRPMDLSHPKGKNPGDFWSICTKPFKGAHLAVYPEAICVNPIKASCPPNGIVLDPMCGSGTTLVVAKKLGRQYIGIDLNPEYVELAKARLSRIPEKLTNFF